ncbi:hypothetical protein [Paenibacillus xylanivorans]|uniref:Uncharacterized protein n=1 Tax=Paenibacillus xylanivorans TaxID=1705561 RepID=A0A0M9BII3_9BACL|nr:hypothetical protein [Paenibacillus xylanivorans]KOY12629.1 hypothetical protein AMS66_29925 [Paenibacillus xylanivorans]
MLYIFITWLILILLLIILAQGMQKNSKVGGESIFKRWGGWLIGFFVVGSVPLGFALYTELREGYIGANIGLGLALFFTWGFCALLLCVALIIWGRYWYKRDRSE